MENSLKKLLLREGIVLCVICGLGAWLYQVEVRYNAYYASCFTSSAQSLKSQLGPVDYYFHFFTESRLVNFLFIAYCVYVWFRLVILPFRNISKKG